MGPEVWAKHIGLALNLLIWSIHRRPYVWEIKPHQPLYLAARLLWQIRGVKEKPAILEIQHFYYLSMAPLPICLPIRESNF